jgi:hypothetical protein
MNGFVLSVVCWMGSGASGMSACQVNRCEPAIDIA